MDNLTHQVGRTPLSESASTLFLKPLLPLTLRLWVLAEPAPLLSQELEPRPHTCQIIIIPALSMKPYDVLAYVQVALTAP